MVFLHWEMSSSPYQVWSSTTSRSDHMFCLTGCLRRKFYFYWTCSAKCPSTKPWSSPTFTPGEHRDKNVYLSSLILIGWHFEINSFSCSLIWHLGAVAHKHVCVHILMHVSFLQGSESGWCPFCQRPACRLHLRWGLGEDTSRGCYCGVIVRLWCRFVLISYHMKRTFHYL